MAEEKRVILTKDGPVATMTFNRPEARNALDDASREAILEALDDTTRDDAIRVLIVTGAGTAFCAGGDIKQMERRLASPPGTLAIGGWRRQRLVHEFVAKLHSFEKPTIAAVNGAATGLGCDVALCCDFIVASEQAMFQMSYVLRGIIPDGGGMYFLPRRVGLPKAKDLIFSARRVMGPEAVAMGMADRLAKPQSLLSDARAWALELAAQPAPAIALAKAIIDRTFESSDEEIYAAGAQAQGIVYSTDEHRAAVAEFLKPRK